MRFHGSQMATLGRVLACTLFAFSWSAGCTGPSRRLSATEISTRGPTIREGLDNRRYADAERKLHRSLEIKKLAYSGEDVHAARTWELLSLTSQRAGRYSDARPPLERALALRRAQPDHPEKATTFALLGDLLWLEGRP